MPIYNERAALPETLASLAGQVLDALSVRYLFVDGGSQDGSAEIVASWLRDARREGCVIVNPQRTIPTSLNRALASVDADEIVVRLDAHTTYGPTYVRDIAAAFATLPDSVGCVGGAQTPDAPHSFDRALSVALMTSRMGLGGAAFRHARTPTAVAGVYLGAWRPGILAALGGFDERWEANEDAELAARLARAGYVTYWIPLESTYRLKRSALQTAAQWHRYGYWRAKTARAYPQTLRPRHLVPLAATAIGGALVLARKPRTLGVLAALYSLAVIRANPPERSFGIALASCVYFPICHVGFAIGFARGIVSGIARAT